MNLPFQMETLSDEVVSQFLSGLFIVLQYENLSSIRFCTFSVFFLCGESRLGLIHFV